MMSVSLNLLLWQSIRHTPAFISPFLKVCLYIQLYAHILTWMLRTSVALWTFKAIHKEWGLVAAEVLSLSSIRQLEGFMECLLNI